MPDNSIRESMFEKLAYEVRVNMGTDASHVADAR